MFLTLPWGILILGKIARGMFCIIKSNYIISCNCFLINREKLGDFLQWTDYRIHIRWIIHTITTNISDEKSIKIKLDCTIVACYVGQI